MTQATTTSPVTASAAVIFDDQAARFGPLTDRRPTFDLRTGILTSRQRIERTLKRDAVALIVPDRLTRAMQLRFPATAINPDLHALTTQSPHPDSHLLLINGRWTGGPPLNPAMVTALPVNHLLLQPDRQVIAAHLTPDDAHQFIQGGFQIDRPAVHAPENVLLTRPWHLLDQLQTLLAHDLAAIDNPIAPNARVHPAAVIDDSHGPVAIDQHAIIGPLAVLEGPCYVGTATVVQPHTYIRPNTIVGEACKVAGEISFSIIHGHTNKAHYGYLGHALVGEWVNLGAGTTVSNLKNTYGEIRVQCTPQPAEPTGRTNHGPIIGDFVRTAIGTLIPTGACIGTGCMIATADFAPKYTPPAGFHTPDGRQPYDPDKFIHTIRLMMNRRNIPLPPAEEDLLRTLIPPT